MISQHPLSARFAIIRRLATTELSTLDLARDLTTMKLAIVKRVREQTGAAQPIAAQAFGRERRALERLRHPQLPRLLGAWHDATGAYLAIEYIEGVTLDQLLHSRALQAAQRLAIARELCTVVAFLHRQSPPLIHADIKPANIIVSRDGRVVLLDFGLAREPGQPSLGPALGTPGYAPPEQWRGEPLGEPADRFALGQVLRELLAELPLPAELGELLARATAPEPADRDASPEQMLAALPLAAERAPERYHRRAAPGLPARLLLAAVFCWVFALVASSPARQSRPQPAPTPALRVARTPRQPQAPTPADALVDAAVVAVRAYQRARAVGIAQGSLAPLDGLAVGAALAQTRAIVEGQRELGARMQIEVLALSVVSARPLDERRVRVVVEKIEDRLLFPAGCAVPDDQPPCRAGAPATVRGERYRVGYTVVFQNARWAVSDAAVE